MSIIDDLELSVRAGNILRMMNPDMTFAEFMALDRRTVMAVRHAGRKTWREIDEMQQHFRSIQREERRTVIGGREMSNNGEINYEFVIANPLRDAAALAALPAIINVCKHDTRDDGETVEQMMARKAWALADAFIAARETKEDDR